MLDEDPEIAYLLPSGTPQILGMNRLVVDDLSAASMRARSRGTGAFPVRVEMTVSMLFFSRTAVMLGTSS